MILRVVHSVKKASYKKISPKPNHLAITQTHITYTKLILYFSLFNVWCKESKNEAKKYVRSFITISICWTKSKVSRYLYPIYYSEIIHLKMIFTPSSKTLSTSPWDNPENGQFSWGTERVNIPWPMVKKQSINGAHSHQSEGNGPQCNFLASPSNLRARERCCSIMFICFLLQCYAWFGTLVPSSTINFAASSHPTILSLLFRLIWTTRTCTHFATTDCSIKICRRPKIDYSEVRVEHSRSKGNKKSKNYTLCSPFYPEFLNAWKMWILRKSRKWWIFA